MKNFDLWSLVLDSIRFDVTRKEVFLELRKSYFGLRRWFYAKVTHSLT